MSTSILVTDLWHQWVQSTFRRPESIILILQGEPKLDSSCWKLALTMLNFHLPQNSLCDRDRVPQGDPRRDLREEIKVHPTASLTLSPDLRFALSCRQPWHLFYDFGPDGGDIIVYSAFADEILNDPSLAPTTMSQDQPG